MSILRSILPCVIFMITIPLTAQITVGTIPGPGILCANVQVELPYDAVGMFNAGNIFTAELSDVNGSFAAPTVLGSVVSTASSTITCVFPAGLSGNGFQLRVNSSDPPEMGVPTAGLLMEAPDAGISGNGTSCGGSANAFPFLGGTPDLGGTWSIISGVGVWAFDDQFTGMVDGEVVGYTVTSPGGCTSLATVTFTVTIPPNAGTNGSLTVCSTGTPVSMISYLGGSPDPGGFWSGPSPPIGGMFDPATMDSGPYGYHVTGMAPCPTASSYLVVMENAAPDAGTNASVTVCSSDPPFNMFLLLGGTPEAGGWWTDPAGSGPQQANVFVPGVSLPGCYTYAVVGTPPCANDASSLCIAVNDAPVLGPDFSITLCGGPPIDMGAGLPAGGMWNYLGMVHSGVFTPGVDAPGPYVYTMPGMPPCANSSLTAMMNIDVPPEAGGDASVNWCVSFGALDLFGALAGSAEVGGSWSDNDNSGGLVGNSFDPVAVPLGSYMFTYTVTGTACPDAQATITVYLAAACLLPPIAAPVE